jgi:polyhydroxyalkanoate synthesis regulator phasin
MGADVLEEMRRLAIFTSGVAELTRNRAEQVVKTFMSDHPEASAAVKQLVEISKQNRQELLRVIAQEMHDQVEALGLASKSDLERIERRLARLEERARSDAASSSSRKTAATRTRSGRTRKSTTGRTTSTAKDKGAKKTAKKTTAKKSRPSAGRS